MSDEDDIRATRSRGIYNRLGEDLRASENNLFDRDTGIRRRGRQRHVQRIDQFLNSDEGIALIPDNETDPIAGIEQHSLSDLFPAPPRPRRQVPRTHITPENLAPPPPVDRARTHPHPATEVFVNRIISNIRRHAASVPSPSMLDQAGSTLTFPLPVLLHLQEIDGYREFWERVIHLRPGSQPSQTPYFYRTRRQALGWRRAARQYPKDNVRIAEQIHGRLDNGDRIDPVHLNRILRECTYSINRIYDLYNIPPGDREL